MGFVLYRSSAGSGKTYTLVKEYLKTILKNPDKFKHILAVTFTNKAAGEMKERIMFSLKKLAKGEDKNLENTINKEMPGLEDIKKISSQILTALLHNYSDFAIMTIDSFIHKVIKAFALEIGLPLNFGIDLNYDKIKSYVTERLLGNVGKDEFTTEIILQFVFERIKADKSWNIEGDIRKFEEELFSEKNLHWVQALEQLDSNTVLLYVEQLKNIRDKYINQINDLGNKAGQLIREAGLREADFAYGKSGSAGFLLRKCAGMRGNDLKTFTISKRLIDEIWVAKSAGNEIKAAVETVLDNGLTAIRETLLHLYDTEHSQALTAYLVLENIYMAAIISQLKRLVDEYKKKNNLIPISEFNTRVYDIVKNSPVPFIYSILGEKYTHYLVDEFQDTSRMQWENLLPLIENSLGSGYFNMAVGDGKQSIYRWRGGDVEIMEKDIEARIFAEQLTIKPLAHNWRSRKHIVDFNNRFFQSLHEHFSQTNELLGQIYSDISQIPVRMDGGFVSLEFIQEPETKKGKKGQPPVRQNMEKEETALDPAETIFEKVHAIIKKHLQRGCRLGDIAILVRVKKEGETVAGRLMQNNIPVVSPDSLILHKTPLIRFLLAILNYLAQPKDKIVGASLIYYLAMYKKENPMDPASIGDYFIDDRQWEISKELEEFDRRKKYLIRMPIYEVMEEVIRVFRLDRDLDFVTTGYLQAFLDIVAGYAAENNVDISSFLDWWEFNKDQFNVIVPEGKEAVKIMTIHKAKGLEFPVVIIPYAGWKETLDDQMWLRSNPPLPTEPVLDMPLPVNRSKSLEDSFFKKELAQEREKVLIDNINLLYVAQTRAVDSLHIIARKNKEPGNYERFRQSAVPLMKEDPGMEGGFCFGETPGPMDVEEKVDEIDFSQADELISQHWVPRILIRRHAKEFWKFDDSYKSEKRNWGILIHEIMAGIRHASDVPRAVAAAVAAGNISSSERKTLETQIRRVVEAKYARHWFLPPYSDKAMNESDIITPRDTLRPDRVMITPNEVVVVDFKTGGKSPDHSRQVETYKQALQKMGYATAKVKGFLFYLNSLDIEEV